MKQYLVKTKTFSIGLFSSLLFGSINVSALVFPDNSSSIQPNGSAQIINGSPSDQITGDLKVLRLTPAEAGKRGSAFSKKLLDIRRFSSAFTFRLTKKGGRTSNDECKGDNGGDGFVFVIQNNQSSIIGSGGGGMGYSGIGRSIGVEFDPYCNRALDPNSNHVAINLNGNVAHNVTLPLATIAPDFNNGKIWHAWVDYDGKYFEVRVSQNPLRPCKPTLIYSIDLQKHLGNPFSYVGFTASTGDSWENHDILTWEFDRSCSSCSKTSIDSNFNIKIPYAELDSNSDFPFSANLKYSPIGNTPAWVLEGTSTVEDPKSGSILELDSLTEIPTIK